MQPGAVSENQSDRNSDAGKNQRLPPDQLSYLFSRGSDGFQQTVKTDIFDHRDLKDIVDDQITGEDDEQQSRDHADDRRRVRLKAGGKIRPVYVVGDVIRVSFFCGIAAFRDNALHFLFQVPGISEHQVRIDDAGHIRIFVDTAVELFDMFFHIGPGYDHDRYVEDGIGFPPAGQE